MIGPHARIPEFGFRGDSRGAGKFSFSLKTSVAGETGRKVK